MINVCFGAAVSILHWLYFFPSILFSLLISSFTHPFFLGWPINTLVSLSYKAGLLLSDVTACMFCFSSCEVYVCYRQRELRGFKFAWSQDHSCCKCHLFMLMLPSLNFSVCRKNATCKYFHHFISSWRELKIYNSLLILKWELV